MMARRGPIPSHGRASCAHDFLDRRGKIGALRTSVIIFEAMRNARWCHPAEAGRSSASGRPFEDPKAAIPLSAKIDFLLSARTFRTLTPSGRNLRQGQPPDRFVSTPASAFARVSVRRAMPASAACLNTSLALMGPTDKTSLRKLLASAEAEVAPSRPLASATASISRALPAMPSPHVTTLAKRSS
jgi:hypothetical protein